MSKAKSDMRPEYRVEDLGPIVRGKYDERFKAGTNLVLLRPEIQKAFPTSDAVNDALATMLAFANETQRLMAPSKRAPKKRAAA